MSGTENIVIAVCAPICIIILAQLMLSMHKTFQSTEIKTDIKKATFAIFICYMIHSVLSAMSHIVIAPELCALRTPLQLVPFTVTRAALYYFFVVRTQHTFSGTVLEFKSSFMKKLKAFIISMYSIFAIFYTISSLFREYDGRLCWFASTSIWLKLYIIMAPLYTLTDFLLGLYIVGVYLHRLWRVHKYLNVSKMEESQRSDPKTPNNPTKSGVASDELLYLIKKQAKLSFVSYLSTIFFVYNTFLGSYITIFSLYADSVVNALCVYCTFVSKQKQYDLLCNCNGKKDLLCVFCFCCYCCNAPKTPKVLNIETKDDAGSKNSPVNISSNNATESGSAPSLKDASDAAETTTVEMVLH